MKTIIVKRSYSFLIGLIIHFFVLISIKTYCCEILNKIDTQLQNVTPHSNDEWYRLLEEQSKYEWLFGITYFITFCVFSIFIIGDAIYRKKYIFILYAIFMLIVAYFPFLSKASVHVYNYNSFYFMFFPLIFYIYYINRDVIVGIKKDKTEEIETELNTKHEDNLKDLDKLFELNLISVEEYNQKKEFHLKEKLRREIKETEEYNLLLKSKQKGLLTEDEFKTKFENLVNLKYNK